MNFFIYRKRILTVLILMCVLYSFPLHAQTDNDAIMMNKYQSCTGATYMHSQWTNYWEGTLKRNNANIGTVKTQSVMAMSNYGITDNLNVMVSAPYVWTHATAGTLHGMKGFQDVSLFVKWKPITIPLGSGKFSIFTIGGVSTPTTNYIAAYLPLSIGMHSTDLLGRLMAYYKNGIFFVRASATYVWRSNITIDQPSYYTTELINSNKVQMPNMMTYNASAGVYTKYFIGEVMYDNMTTLGGFDMRRNDMPFPSNKMNGNSIGVHAKYTLPFYTHVSVVAGGDRVLSGRNIGQSTTFSLGAFYAFYVKHNSKNSSLLNNNQ